MEHALEQTLSLPLGLDQVREEERIQTQEQAGGHATPFDDLEGLMVTYRARVLRFVAFSVRDLDVAESITQDCFLKAWRSRQQFRGDCAVPTWLMRIAHHLVCDYTRTERWKFWKAAASRSVDAGEIAGSLPDGGASPERQLLARERVGAILKMMEELPDRQRSVFSLYYLEEMSVDEIAKSLGMPGSTVKTHLYRATAKLRKGMGGQK